MYMRLGIDSSCSRSILFLRFSRPSFNLNCASIYREDLLQFLRISFLIRYCSLVKNIFKIHTIYNSIFSQIPNFLAFYFSPPKISLKRFRPSFQQKLKTYNRESKMGQCETCTKQLEYNAIDSDDLLTKLQPTEIGRDIQKLRTDNRDSITNFKFTPMPDKSFYKGKLSDTKREGYGQNYADCFNYFGFYKNNMPNGLGTIITEHQCIYGQFQNGVLHGKGKEWGQGITFEGTYKKGQRTQGRFVTDEVTYNGKFLNNLYHGQGTLTFKNGSSYTGQFQNGKFHGQGELVLQSGCKYKGGFRQGVYEGYGEYKWPNGNFYRGQYHEGKRSGFGTLKIGNLTYEGNWKNGARQGHGILTHQQDFAFGNWQNNILTEQ